MRREGRGEAPLDRAPPLFSMLWRQRSCCGLPTLCGGYRLWPERRRSHEAPPKQRAVPRTSSWTICLYSRLSIATAEIGRNTAPLLSRLSTNVSRPRRAPVWHSPLGPFVGRVLESCLPGRAPSYIATPLMLAAASSSPNAATALRILLDAGAGPRTRSTRGDPALWFAAAAGNTRGM